MQQLPLSDEFGGQHSKKIFIKYDGTDDALAKHEIDVFAYTSSITGYVLFTRKTVEQLLGKNVNAKITAHKEGSFLDVINITWDTVARLNDLAGIAAFFGISAPHIKKSAKKILIAMQRKIAELIVIHSGNTYEIVNSIENSKELPTEVKYALKKIVKDNEARKGLDSFTSPLDKNGYDEIDIYDEENDRFKILSTHRQAFRYTPPDEVFEEPYEDIVSIVYISPELSKWQFKGKRTFWANVSDDDFLKRTKDKKFSELRGRAFSVIGVKTSIMNDGKIKGTPTYTIDKATEVPEQISLI